MIEELFIALSLDADTAKPARVEDVYSTGHSRGEYVFYAAADKKHGPSDGDPAQIDENTMRVNFMVDVNFEDDAHRVALEEIEDVKRRLVEGDNYEQYSDDVGMEGPGGFLDAFDFSPVYLPVDAGENWASWVYASQFGDSAPSLRVSFQSVEENRTLSIKAHTISDDFTLEEIVEHWEGLVEKYRKMPMKGFKA